MYIHNILYLLSIIYIYILLSKRVLIFEASEEISMFFLCRLSSSMLKVELPVARILNYPRWAWRLNGFNVHFMGARDMFQSK